MWIQLRIILLNASANWHHCLRIETASMTVAAVVSALCIFGQLHTFLYDLFGLFDIESLKQTAIYVRAIFRDRLNISTCCWFQSPNLTWYLLHNSLGLVFYWRFNRWQMKDTKHRSIDRSINKLPIKHSLMLYIHH